MWRQQSSALMTAFHLTAVAGWRGATATARCTHLQFLCNDNEAKIVGCSCCFLCQQIYTRGKF